MCFTGKLHFVKFETSKVEECIAFIKAKGGYGCHDLQIYVQRYNAVSKST
jgi:hypothetical protein